MNKVVEKILPILVEEFIFEGFKIRKSDECLIKKSNEGFEKVSLNDHFQSIDLNNYRLALQIRPNLYRRFDVLSKWFEKYSFKDIKTQRSSGQVFKNVGGFGKVKYLFYNDMDCFEEQYHKIRNDIVSEANIFFEKYSTMESMYINDVIPLLRGEKELPTNGADWIFEKLKLTWIVDRHSYNNLKSLFLKQIEYMMFGRTFQEPNIARYYDRLDEIFADLEQD